MSVTREKMAAQLRRAIQAVLDRGLHDPRIKGLISVTRVELSNDFMDATVHVTVLPEDRAELSLHGLVSATPHVRSQIARRGDFRRVPTLHFRRDVVRRREADVLTAIARATAEDEARAAVRGTDGDGPSAWTRPGVGDAMEEDGRGVDRGAADADADADTDVLAAFDAFVDASGGKPPAGGSDDPSGDDQGPDGLEEQTKHGDRPWRRPEDDAT